MTDSFDTFDLAEDEVICGVGHVHHKSIVCPECAGKPPLLIDPELREQHYRVRDDLTGRDREVLKLGSSWCPGYSGKRYCKYRPHR